MSDRYLAIAAHVTLMVTLDWLNSRPNYSYSARSDDVNSLSRPAAGVISEPEAQLERTWLFPPLCMVPDLPRQC